MAWRVFAVLAFTGVFGARSAFAQKLLTFDELQVSTQTQIQISNGYGGLRWTNFFVANAALAQAGSIISRAMVSGSNVLASSNRIEILPVIYSGHPFDLKSAWVTAQEFSGNVPQLNVVALFGTVAVFTNSYALIPHTPTLVHFDMQNITGARFSTLNVLAPFALDNIVVDLPEETLPTLPGWFKAGQLYFPPGDALSVGAGDLNGDGHTDLVMSSTAGASVHINTGNGSFQRRDISVVDGNFITIGDFTNDGREDAVVSDTNTFRTPTTRLIQFTNYFNFTLTGLSNVFGVVALGDFGGTNRLVSARRDNDIAAADFNGDGSLDLVELNDEARTLFVSTNVGNGSFKVAFSTNVALSEAYSSVCVADFDADGDADFAVAYQNSGLVAMYYNNGKASFKNVTKMDSGLARPVSIAAADLDGDGLADIVVRSAFSGLSLLRNLGGGRFDAAIVITDGDAFPRGGQSPRSLAVRDFNDDGAPDIAFVSGTEVVTLLNIYPPRIAIRPIADLVQVYWPTNFAKNATVEYTTSVGPNATWLPVAFPPLDVGAYRTIFDASEHPQLFFRLRRP